MKRIKLIIIIIFAASCIQAQHEEAGHRKPQRHSHSEHHQGVDSSIVTYYQHLETWKGDSSIYNFDTTTARFSNISPLREDKKYFAWLGNYGTAHQSMVYEPVKSTDFDFGFHSFDEYLKRPENIKYYNSEKPFSEMYYIQAPSGGKVLNALLSQQMTEELKMGIAFNYSFYPTNTNSYPDKFGRQFSNNNNVALKARYTSKDKRYKAIANYTNSRVRVRENGGLRNYDEFLQNTLSTPAAYAVRLSSAENNFFESGVYLNHSYEPGAIPFLSRHRDSTESKERKFSLGKLEHTLKYRRQKLMYLDDAPSSGYYTYYAYDSVSTFDSTFNESLINEIAWSSTDRIQNKYIPKYKFALQHERIVVDFGTGQEKFSQITPSARISQYLFKGIYIGGQARYVKGGYNDNDLLAQGVLIKHFNNKDTVEVARLDANITFSLNEAPYFFNHFHSNHFRWGDLNHKQTTLDKQVSLSIEGSFEYKDLEIGAAYYQLNNIAYINSDTVPSQSGMFPVLKAYAYHDLDFWKLRWNNRLVYQATLPDAPLSVPSIIGSSSIYYQNNFFDDALDFTIGIEGHYNTAYYADDYMPALQTFYNQNTRQVGNYAYIDINAIMKISRARILVKYSHANKGLMGYHYAMIPNYPSDTGGIFFAISWRFYD